MKDKKKNIIIVGGSGYIGSHLTSKLETLGYNVLNFSRSSSNFPFDLNIERLKNFKLSTLNVSTIIFSCGITNVNTCENEPDKTANLNVERVLLSMQDAANERLRIIYLSSDYIYSGDNVVYTENSISKPLQEYGKQKVIVENELSKITNNYLNVRLTKVYSIESNNFLTNLVKSLYQKEDLNIFKDQFFRPILIHDLCNIFCMNEIMMDLTGKINISGKDLISRVDLVNYCINKTKLSNNNIKYTSVEGFRPVKLPKILDIQSSLGLYSYNNTQSIYDSLDKIINLIKR